MKKLSSVQLALSFAGFFLGAGYVSGQELWQFFGQFGYLGIAGLVLALALLFGMGLVIVELSRKTGFQEPDKLIVRKNIPALRFTVSALEFILLFGVVMIMTAGVGALLNTLFSIPAFIGSMIFAVVVLIVSFSGFSGMVSAFSFTVPALCVFTVMFGVLSIAENGLTLPAQTSGGNALLNSWFVSALSFSFYNIFGTIAMLSPLSGSMKSSRSGVSGMALGTLLLFIIAGSVLIVVSSAPEYAMCELPMLSYCLDKSFIFALLYGLLLLFAMFGTGLSSFVGFINMAVVKLPKLNEHAEAFSVICAAAAFLGSLLGFGDLIGIIYPICGYCSSIIIVMMVIHYLRVR